MKTFFSFFFGVLCTSVVLSQSNTAVNLVWKIAPSDSIVYKTIMDDIDSVQNVSGFDPLLVALIDSAKAQKRAYEASLPDSVRNQKNLFVAMMNGDKPNLFSKLTHQKQGIIDVKMYAVKSEKARAADRKTIEDAIADAQARATKLGTTVDSTYRQTLERSYPAEPKMLTGSVYAKGGVSSFYIQSGQKNLLALFFELPQNSIKIGDTWDLDVKFINMNLTKCDSAFQKHTVTFKELRKQGQDNIAVLEYDCAEFARGEFGDTMQSGMSYKAIAEFSLNKGRWVKYDGIISMRMEGGLANLFGQNPTTTQLFSLKQE